MIYVYAVLRAEASMPPIRGIEEASVVGRAVAGLTLAVSEHEAEPEPTNEAVLRHAQVVEALASSDESVLPARFGLAFADPSALEREVEAKAASLLGALDHVRGCAEVGLRVLSQERAKEPEPTLDGAGYLRARLRESTEREHVAVALHDVLARHARDSTRRAHDGGRLLLDAAYLVPRGDVDAFRQEVGKLGRSHPDLALVCTGPWPPYSFAPAAEASL